MKKTGQREPGRELREAGAAALQYVSVTEQERRRIESKALLDAVEPFAEELLLSLGREKGYVLVISDRDGIVLDIKGEDTFLEQAAGRRLACGVSMHLQSAGMNAIGRAIRERKPVQVSGEEHQFEDFRQWTCVAAPVHDHNNRLLGTVCLVAPLGIFHEHTFSLVLATCRAMESNIHNSFIQSELYNAHQYAFSIMNHLSFGLIAIDLGDRVRWVNDTACRAINIRRASLIGREIREFFSEWSALRKGIEGGERVLDREVRFSLEEESDSFLINAYAIRNIREENIGFVITFRPFSRMLSLVNKYSSSYAHFTFEHIVTRSRSMKKLVSYARTVANTPSSVLLTGESGTGKEVFAQAIHSASERREHGFVAINCGAISSSLIESELFGYEEGAFTGALKGGHPGKLELANGGTLFLDEIGEMPIEMQVKLLRVLQEKSFSRVGGNKVIRVDIRVIAATNRDLEEEVRQGNFRQDLYYRLNVIPMHIPALRERQGDIPYLFRYFLGRKAEKLNRPIPAADEETLARLTAYPWPGNVRELENFAEKSVIFGGDIAELLPEASGKQDETSGAGLQFARDGGELPTMDEVEKQVIERYIGLHDYNLSRTARALGIGRNTLYTKMEKYGIPKDGPV